MANEFKVKHGLVVNGPIELKNAANQSKSGSIKINDSSLLETSIGIYSSGDITSSGAKIGSGTGYVSSSAGVYSTKAGSAVMADLGAYRTITINGTSNEVQVNPAGAQKLSADRTWTIGLPNNVTITKNLTIGDNVASDVFSSGFGGSGFAISQSNNRYIAQFDDLWVRGSMNVYEMVINQIRSTNGSLWVSDTAKAISASYNSTNKRIVLRFQTGSLIPFIAGDILRSKRWGLSGSTTQSQWDITTTVSSVNYASGYVTLSAPTINNLYTYTSSANGTWAQFVSKISNSGSQWVRVGNTTTESNRDGSIYITSNDLGGPFLDVYDLVTSSVQATGGISGSVRQSKTRVRLGQLSGIVDSNFGGALSGYGLYADNVYLRGTISATAGTFSGKVTANEGSIGGWDINSSGLSAGDQNQSVWIGPKFIQFTSNDRSDYLLIGTKSGYLTGFGIGFFPNDNPGTTPYFKVDKDGAFLSGSITASAGKIGGWNINATNLSSSGIALVSGNSPAIKIGNASAFNTGTGIFMSGSSNTSYLRVGQTTGTGRKYLLWDGTNLSWQTPNFTMSTAGTMTITGSVNATSGYFGGSLGWQIKTGKITTSGIELLSGNSPAIKIGASAYSGNGIWLGKDTLYKASFWNTSNARGLKWDGQNLIISASNFSLDTNGKISANDAVISGSIKASAGTIGGWTINSNGLSSSNVTISSQTNYQGIRITTASKSLNITSSLNYIYLGKWNSDNVLHLKKDNSNYFKWDANGLNIKSPKLTLSPDALNVSGSITTSAGLFGGWNINSGGISSTHPYGTVSITKSGTSNLTLTDTYGNFTYSAANSHMFTNKTNLYQKTSASFIPTITKYESDLNITMANPNKGFGIQFTDWCPDPGTPLIAFEISNIDEGVQYTLQSKVINPKNTADLQYVSSLFFAITSNLYPYGDFIFINTENPLWKRNSSENEILKQYKFSIPKGVGGPKVYLWLMGTMRPNSGVSIDKKPTFTFSGFRIDSYKQYTQLSQKGLLVFNTPQNYIQLVSENGSTTNSSQASLGLVNIETLYVNGISVNSALTNPLYNDKMSYAYTLVTASNLPGVTISSTTLKTYLGDGSNVDYIRMPVNVQWHCYEGGLFSPLGPEAGTSNYSYMYTESGKPLRFDKVVLDWGTSGTYSVIINFGIGTK